MRVELADLRVQKSPLTGHVYLVAEKGKRDITDDLKYLGIIEDCTHSDSFPVGYGREIIECSTCGALFECQHLNSQQPRSKPTLPS